MTDEEKAIKFAEWKAQHVRRHGLRGYFSLADLPQRPSLAQHAFGTGWWELDQVLKFYFGQFIVLTGVAGQGKSTFILNVLCNLARAAICSFLYVPENEAYLREKLRLLWAHDASFDEACQSRMFVQSATEGVDEEPHTLDWVLERAAVAVREDGAKVVLIDPWNELEHFKPRDQMMTDYIAQSLVLIKRFCRALNAIVILVAHPTKAVNERGGRPPTLADIEGSMAWFNKCDNGLIVVREENNRTRVISAKVRENGAGKVGCCWFTVDPESGIFKPEYGAVT